MDGLGELSTGWDVFASVEMVGIDIMDDPEYRVKVCLWLVTDDGEATIRIKKLGRVFHDAGMAERVVQQTEAACQLLQIPVRETPPMTTARMAVN